MIERILDKGTLIAIIISSSFKKDGIHFFTPDESPQQLGYMNRPAGYVIAAHTHRPIPRSVHHSQEVLFIKSGKVRIDFYDDCRVFLQSRVVAQGDVVMLASGGHGFEILEDAEMIEVKQGPYLGDDEKILYTSNDKQPG